MPESTVSKTVWRTAVLLFLAVLTVGAGLVVAIASGLRRPTPHRAPDWAGADLQWHLQGSGIVTDTGGNVHLRLPLSNQRLWTVADPALADLEVQLDARALNSGEAVDYGLLFRYQDSENHYLFGVSGDGYYSIARFQEGELTPLRDWQQWPHVRRGNAANRLRIRCRDAICQFYINGELTARIGDVTIKRGKIGLWAQSFATDTAEVRFDNIQLWRLD